jgi:hypothetical protein
MYCIVIISGGGSAKLKIPRKFRAVLINYVTCIGARWPSIGTLGSFVLCICFRLPMYAPVLPSID